MSIARVTSNESLEPYVPRASHRGYCYDPEEVPMTLQIALVATDGIVLGSDREMSFSPPDAPFTTSEVSKIFRDDSRGVMTCWSGSDPSRVLARQIIGLPDDRILNPGALESLAARVFAEESQRLGITIVDGDVLVISKTDLKRVYHTHFHKTPCCIPKFDKAVSGHTSNPSVYFTQRFYDKLPMVKLIGIVAHTILDAAPKKGSESSGIRGLEIVCCSKDGLRVMPDDEINHLVRWSEDIGDLIRTRILSPMNKSTA